MSEIGNFGHWLLNPRIRVLQSGHRTRRIRGLSSLSPKLYRLKRRWRDGTSHMIFEPLELVEKLAALVPPPRFNLVRYHGVLAPPVAAEPTG